MFFVFLFPLFWLPVMFLFNLLSVNSFVTLNIAFIVSCVIYAIFENGFYSCIALLFLIFLIQALRTIMNVANKSFVISNKCSTVLIIKALEDGTALAFDGRNIISFKIDNEFPVREGSVLPISINGF